MRLCTRWGPSSPSPKKTILAHEYCGQTAGWINIPLGTEVGLRLGDIVLDGDPAPPPLKGHSPQFSVNVRYGQMAGWAKMPLGTELDLGADDFVFDGDPAPQKKRHSLVPNFWPMTGSPYNTKSPESRLPQYQVAS